jgi:hypothetical protein
MTCFFRKIESSEQNYELLIDSRFRRMHTLLLGAFLRVAKRGDDHLCSKKGMRPFREIKRMSLVWCFFSSKDRISSRLAVWSCDRAESSRLSSLSLLFQNQLMYELSFCGIASDICRLLACLFLCLCTMCFPVAGWLLALGKSLLLAC